MKSFQEKIWTGKFGKNILKEMKIQKNLKKDIYKNLDLQNKN